MAIVTTTGIPAIITKGDAYSFQIPPDSDHPIDTWVTPIIYFKAGTAVASFTGTVSDGYYLFSLTNSNTNTLSAGANVVSVAFSDGTNRFSSGDTRQVTVLENPATAHTASVAETILAAIETAITSSAGKSSGSVSADGVSFSWRSLAELQSGHVYWKARVIAEQRASNAAQGIPAPRIITTFSC